MVRKKLAEGDGQRKRFRGVFSRFGKKVSYQGHSEPTVLLVNIVDAETLAPVTGHLWFAFTRGFEKLKLEEGVIVEFDARIKEYTKGYVNRRYSIDNSRKDFKLSHPTRICIVRDTM